MALSVASKKCMFCDNVATRAGHGEKNIVSHCDNCTPRGPKPLLFLQPEKPFAHDEIERIKHALQNLDSHRFVVLPHGMTITDPSKVYSFTEKMGEYEYSVSFKTLAELKDYIASHEHKTRGEPPTAAPDQPRRGREFL